MSDKQSIPKDLDIGKLYESLGLTNEDFKTAEALNAKLFPTMSDAYKKAGDVYVTRIGPSGTLMFNIIIKFYQDIYSKMDDKDISDEIITQYITDNYGEKSPYGVIHLWLVKPEYLPETITLLRNALRIKKSLFPTFEKSNNGPTQAEEDRAIFDPKRFGKKLGMYVGVAFGISLLLSFMALSPSLIMNDFIYKPAMMRIVLGIYASLLFIFIIPYYFFIGFLNNSRSPKLFALFPVVTQLYEWDFSNYCFGPNSYLTTVYDGNDIDIRNAMTWLRDKPHPKDLNPIPITLESLSGN